MAMDMQAAVKISASVQGKNQVDDLKRSLDGVSNTANTMGSKFAALGTMLKTAFAAVAIRQIVDLGKGIISGIAALDDMSEKTGASVEKLSALASVAKVSGVEMDTVSEAMVKLTKNLKNADADGRGTAEAIKFLGINFAEFKKMDPADQMQRVAKEMDRFRDGTGKTALALDLFGKTGANMLPFLKDLAEAGDVQGKVTARAAAEAETFEKALNRWNMQTNDLYKSMAVALLPTLNEFISGLTNMRGEAGKFGDHPELVEWTQSAIKGFAAVADVVVFLGRVLSALKGQFKIAFTDMSLLATLATDGVKAIWNDEASAKLQAALEARNKIVRDENQKLVDLWNYDGSRFYDAATKAFTVGDGVDKLREAFAAREKVVSDSGKRIEQSAAKWAGSLRLFDMGAKPQANYTPKTDGDSKLEKELETIEKYKIAQQGLIEGRKLELESVSMTAIEYKNLSDTRALDQKNAEMSVKLSASAKAELDKVTASLKQQVVAFNELEYARKRSFEYGAQKFFKDYAEEASNMAKATENALKTGFKAAEDAIVDFVKTGKIEFKSLADTIVTELLRIFVRQQMLGPLASWMGGMLGPTGGGGPMQAPYAKGGAFVDGYEVQAFASGGVVSRPTLFPMARGVGLMGEAGPEAIMPLRRGPDGKLGVAAQGGGGTAVVINNYSTSQASARETVDSRGNRRVEVTIGELVAAEVRRAGSAAHNAMRETFGAQPALVGR